MRRDDSTRVPTEVGGLTMHGGGISETIVPMRAVAFVDLGPPTETGRRRWIWNCQRPVET